MTGIKCLKRIRKQLTKAEINALNAVKALAETANNKAFFTISGSLDLPEADDERCTLYYRSGEQAKLVDLPASEDNMVQLYNIARPAPYGQDGETVFNEEYRMARELKTNEFAINFDFIPGMLHKIQTALPTDTVRRVNRMKPSSVATDDEATLIAKLHKLNVYSQGDFFKSHRDTPRSDNHIGSLVVCLPSTFSGGQLVIKQQNKTVNYDWAEACGAGQISWAFLYSDCEHEVLPVSSGARLTLGYDVYTEKVTDRAVYVSNDKDEVVVDIKAASAHIKDYTENRKFQEDLIRKAKIRKDCKTKTEDFASISRSDIYEGLLRLLAVPSKEVKTVAFGMKHQYPSAKSSHSRRNYIEPLALKGVDRVIHQCAVHLGLQVELVAILHADRSWLDYQASDDEAEDDDASQHTFCISTRCDFGMAEEESENLAVDSISNGVATKRKDLIWLSELGSQFIGGNYLAYGNEASIGHIYVSGAILITIPVVTKEQQKSQKRARK